MRRLLDYEYSYPPTALVITSEAGKKGFGTMEIAGLRTVGEPCPKTGPRLKHYPKMIDSETASHAKC
jgi:hypothetical protein